MTPSRRMVELVGSLLGQTRAGKVRWRRSGPETYLYGGKAGSLMLFRSGEDPLRIYSLVALDPHGEPIERAVHVTTVLVNREADDIEQDARILELWQLASRTAEEGDPQLDRILADVRGA